MTPSFPRSTATLFEEVSREQHVSESGARVRVRALPAAARSVTRLLAGTSGWSYPSWQPGFYPAGLDRSAFLSFYAGRLDAVELNATKYRLPSQAQFESWAAQVPDGFRFAVKAPDGVERRLDVFQERVLRPRRPARLRARRRRAPARRRLPGAPARLLRPGDPLRSRPAPSVLGRCRGAPRERQVPSGSVRRAPTPAGPTCASASSPTTMPALEAIAARIRAHRCRLHRGVRVLPPRRRSRTRPPRRSVSAPCSSPERARAPPVAEAPSRSIGCGGAGLLAALAVAAAAA